MKWNDFIQTAALIGILAVLVILMIRQSRQAVDMYERETESLKEEVEDLKVVRDSLKGQLREADTILSKIVHEEISIDSADSIIAQWERTKLR